MNPGSGTLARRLAVAFLLLATVLPSLPVWAESSYEEVKSKPIGGKPVVQKADITLEKAGYFRAPDGRVVKLSPGRYEARLGEAGQLRLVSQEHRKKELVINVLEMRHEERVNVPTALSIVSDNSEHHLVLLFPGGRGFDAGGFITRQFPRGARKAPPVETELIQKKLGAQASRDFYRRDRPELVLTKPRVQSDQPERVAPGTTAPSQNTLPELSSGVRPNRKEAEKPVRRLEISAPSEGSTWRINFTYDIHWQYSYVRGRQRDFTANREVDIDLIDANGGKILDIFEGIGSGTHSWTIPSGLATGNYRIRAEVSNLSRQSGVFRIDSKVPLVVRLSSTTDVNEVWSMYEENGQIIRKLEIPDLAPHHNPTSVAGETQYPRYAAREIIHLDPAFLHNLQFIQENHPFYSDSRGWISVLLPEPCDTRPFWPGKQRHEGYTILRETITLYGPPTYFYFERRGRMEQILRGPDGQIYIFVVFTRDVPGGPEDWMTQALQAPILLERAITSGYRAYALDELTGKVEPFSATGE